MPTLLSVQYSSVNFIHLVSDESLQLVHLTELKLTIPPFSFPPNPGNHHSTFPF